MTDDTEATKDNTALTRDMLRHAHMVTTDRAEQIAALVTAATVQIERHAGATHAAGTLWSLLEPTLADWRKAEGAIGEAEVEQHVVELADLILHASASGTINPDHLFMACLTAARSLAELEIGTNAKLTPVRIALTATGALWRAGRA